MKLVFTTIIMLGLVTARAARADSHGHPLVVKQSHDDVEVTVTLSTEKPKANEDVELTVRLVQGDHHDKSKHMPIADASSVQAHLGHGKDTTDIPLVPDAKDAGSYRGTLKFEHEGKETFHVGIKRADKDKEWTIRVAVTVTH